MRNVDQRDDRPRKEDREEQVEIRHVDEEEEDVLSVSIDDARPSDDLDVG